jgi:hypothetical protein
MWLTLHCCAAAYDPREVLMWARRSAIIAAFLRLVLFVMPYEGAGCRSGAGVPVTDFVSDDGTRRGALGGIVLTRLVLACGENRLARSENDGES